MGGGLGHNFRRRLDDPNPDRQLKARYVRDLYRDPCVYCQGPADSLDHIVPLSAGGSKTSSLNLAPACTKCNSRKGSLPLLDFLILQRVGAQKLSRKKWRQHLRDLPPPRPLLHRPFECLQTFANDLPQDIVVSA